LLPEIDDESLQANHSRHVWYSPNLLRYGSKVLT